MRRRGWGESPSWDLAGDVLEHNLGPWIPFGKRCLIRGKMIANGSILVNIGANVFLQMTTDEARSRVEENLGRTLRRPGTIEEGEEGEFDIREELNKDDLAIMVARDRPRIAHTFTVPLDTKFKELEKADEKRFGKTKRDAKGSSEEERDDKVKRDGKGREMTMRLADGDSRPLSLSKSKLHSPSSPQPLKDKVIERNPFISKPIDPASRVIGNELKESLFRRTRQKLRDDIGEDENG